MNTVEQFLHYAVEHGRDIRLMWMEQGKLCQSTVSVCGWDGERATLLCRRPKRMVQVALTDILSADFAKSDKEAQ